MKRPKTTIKLPYFGRLMRWYNHLWNTSWHGICMHFIHLHQGMHQKHCIAWDILCFTFPFEPEATLSCVMSYSKMSHRQCCGMSYTFQIEPKGNNKLWHGLSSHPEPKATTGCSISFTFHQFNVSSYSEQKVTSFSINFNFDIHLFFPLTL
jgi:hypothetical protein